MMAPPDRDPLLQEREKTHGSFAANATFAQGMRKLFRVGITDGQTLFDSHFDKMKPVHREALDMIALKLSRILSGQADFRDHWDDIAGYAKLGSEACE